MDQLSKKDRFTITISLKSIALFTLIPLCIYLLWIVKDLIFSLLIGFILMSALKPAVNFLSSKKLSRTLAVILVYLLFILFIIALFSLIIPPIIYETSVLIMSLPYAIEDLIPQISNFVNISDLTSFVPNVTTNIFSIISSIFSNALFVITTLFFGLYFLLEENLWEKTIGTYFKKETSNRIISIIEKVEKRMSSWFWGELTLMTVVGLLTFLGLHLIGMGKYAIPLAVLAGLLEVVPNIGPVISAIPAIILGFVYSSFTGFVALALYVVVQQLENTLIVPLIMKHAVGLNPILTLVALILGGRLGGILGVLLAIPLFLVIETIVSELLHQNNKS
ncbi:MAG TPA: AI-2E family transporter [Candidatus Woesebacteria bacterium]|nr:AI-2E family transporter [Candidatus Woesebacteria bacterium]